MQIAVHNDAKLADALHSYVERRLRFALGRFGARVGQVTVKVGAEGPINTCCRVSAEIIPFGRVTIEERDPNLFAAIDRATGRIGRLFGRELERSRRFPNRESVRKAA